MTGTILIVDDYPDALDVWDLYLRASGFEVLRAEDGTEALRCACEEKPDLVVMDLELPGLTGVQVARALRERLDTRHIPLAVSQHPEEVPPVSGSFQTGLSVEPTMHVYVRVLPQA